MKSLIESLALDPEVPVRLHPSLAAVVEPGFVRVNGPIVLKTLAQEAKAISVSDFPDETGYESFVNHVHIEDRVRRENGSTLALLADGISLASSLRTLLHRSFPGEEFEVILSLEGSHCTVRFHKKRMSEQWLRDDLDSYLGEALMVLET
jgi:hypothetical protein